jgi:hypothetical protein
VVVALFLLGFPLRTYVEQRAALSGARQTAARLADQNAALRSEAARLQTPAEIGQLARERYGLVHPGQEEYAILPAPVTAGSRAGHTAAPGSSVTFGATQSGGASPGGSSAGGSSAGGSAAPASSGGLWSRFVRQLEFWS